ncbi:tRNA lysidine(34) synthetase TilS [Bifidobacterium indicum]|uniref:tRNA lysidine(34) synthetase TilS n=1 Tax=Bifidobacterium indicum TaxID=1691 RepID=UPI002603BEB3|nr:tRNA lysidine(34) synthetase TilS [uncultured Bifidobacterium sp.]
MVYSAQMKKAVGALRSCLEDAGLRRQDGRFARHGRHRPDPDAPLILVACSGGRDSMALAAVSAKVSAMLGLRCGAVLIDHGLAKNSDRISLKAATDCRRMGLDPVRVRPIHVPRTGAGLEADAREARYEALGEEARQVNASVILLAHTMDDQAETALIGLIRSRGLDAITGMDIRMNRGGLEYLRPFLGMTRQDTTQICLQQGLSWWDDPTNGDGYPADHTLPDDFPLRSRVRHDLLPALSRFAGHDMVRSLAQGADMARRDAAYLNRQAAALVDQVIDAPEPDDAAHGILVRLNARRLRDQDPALRLRFMVHLLTDLGIQADSSQIRALDSLVSDWHGQRGPAFPSSYSAFRKSQVILICNDGHHANR